MANLSSRVSRVAIEFGVCGAFTAPARSSSSIRLVDLITTAAFVSSNR